MVDKPDYPTRSTGGSGGSWALVLVVLLIAGAIAGGTWYFTAGEGTIPYDGKDTQESHVRLSQLNTSQHVPVDGNRTEYRFTENVTVTNHTGATLTQGEHYYWDSKTGAIRFAEETTELATVRYGYYEQKTVAERAADWLTKPIIWGPIGAVVLLALASWIRGKLKSTPGGKR